MPPAILQQPNKDGEVHESAWSRNDLIQGVVGVDVEFGPYLDGYYSGDTNRELAEMMSLNYFIALMRNLRFISCSAVGAPFVCLSPWVVDTLAGLEHLQELSGVSFAGMQSEADTGLSSQTLSRLGSLRKLVGVRWSASFTSRSPHRNSDTTAQAAAAAGLPLSRARLGAGRQLSQEARRKAQ